MTAAPDYTQAGGFQGYWNVTVTNHSNQAVYLQEDDFCQQAAEVLTCGANDPVVQSAQAIFQPFPVVLEPGGTYQFPAVPNESTPMSIWLPATEWLNVPGVGTFSVTIRSAPSS